MPEKIETIGQFFDKGCDTCPFWDECFDYQLAFGDGECLRDDWAKSLLDYLKNSGEGIEKWFKQRD